MTNEELSRDFDIVWDGSLYPLPSSDPAPAVAISAAQVRDLLDSVYPKALALGDIGVHFGCIRDLAWPAVVELLNARLAERVNIAEHYVRRGSGRKPAYAYRAAMRRES
jgi:hypothetical protein